MKRLLSMFMLVIMLMCLGQFASADDTGIMIIGGPETEMETVSLDDFKVGDVAEIDGYGEVSFVSAIWSFALRKYNSQTAYGYSDWVNCDYYDAGSEAIYLRLWFDILNTQKEPYDFYEDFSEIICTYDDEYQFGGWVRKNIIIEDDGESLLTLAASEGGYPIDTMYRGDYSVVVTLPLDVYTRVTEQGKPLTVSFKLGENEFNYIYRK